MYTLYYSPGTASMLVHLMLLETGAAHRLQLVDIDKQQQKDPAYLRLNPNGVVPTLVLDEQPYTEAAAIAMLLAERHPESGLAPARGTVAYDLWRQWMLSLSHNLQASFRLWFYPQELGNASHPEALSQAIQQKIARIWDQLDHHLNQQGPYLLGEQFTCADLYLTMLMRWSRNMPHPATEWPALRALTARVVQRPAWQRMMEIEAVDPWPRDLQS